ncbi:unnamed protein product [Phytophthora fragariaefolia]|uniref:Unnamed protein product n=1 Tax=Phytophthora fragariaefolia TaxID=1490495 RepID=A0A9W6WII2_9STRA|nr:unnamed protein product [Phytophthora fragariaefolia]
MLFAVTKADWKKVIHYAAFAVQASYHSILNASPGQLVFGQHMISRRLYEANWSYLSKRRFYAILADNDRENAKRLVHFYNPGDQVMIRVPKQFRAKTKRVADGPYQIRSVHDNGTVTVDKGSTQQQVSIRHIFPCYLSQLHGGRMTRLRTCLIDGEMERTRTRLTDGGN